VVKNYPFKGVNASAKSQMVNQVSSSSIKDMAFILNFLVPVFVMVNVVLSEVYTSTGPKS